MKRARLQSIGLITSMVAVPLGLAAGWMAGKVAAKRAVRREMNSLHPVAPPPAVPPSKAVPLPKAAPVPVAPVVPRPAPPAELEPETILILSAVVAAVLGKKARIRSARLLPGTMTGAWAQQGRASVQASHNLAFARHGR